MSTDPDVATIHACSRYTIRTSRWKLLRAALTGRPLEVAGSEASGHYPVTTSSVRVECYVGGGGLVSGGGGGMVGGGGGSFAPGPAYGTPGRSCCLSEPGTGHLPGCLVAKAAGLRGEPAP